MPGQAAEARSGIRSYERGQYKKTWVPGTDERGRIAIWQVPLLAENLIFGTFGSKSQV